MGLFGWYGRLDSRQSRGELASSTPIPPVQYISYDEVLFGAAADSTRLEFLTFAVTLQDRPTPTVATETTQAPSSIPFELLVGVGVAVVLAVLVVILIIVLVCVFGRKRNQPKKKKKYVSSRVKLL